MVARFEFYGRRMLNNPARRDQSGRECPSAGHPLVLVCAADDGYAKPLAVTLCSALANYNGPHEIKMYIVDGGMRPATRARIERVLQPFGVVPEWLEPDFAPVEHLVVTGRYPRSIYLRLLLPWLLSPSIEKVIYLDSDLVVEGNLADLWNVNVGRHTLLAVQDEGAPTVGSPWGLSNYRELGLTPSAPYFNSGVMVLNLPQWRQRRISEHVIDYIATNPDHMRFGEQDALNAILARSWGALDPVWNQLVSPWEGHNGRHYATGILHFVSSYKPWTAAGAHWTNYIYDRCLKRTGWYSQAQWWLYYVPLAVHRQLVLLIRERQAMDASRANHRDPPERSALAGAPAQRDESA